MNAVLEDIKGLVIKRIPYGDGRSEIVLFNESDSPFSDRYLSRSSSFFEFLERASPMTICKTCGNYSYSSSDVEKIYCKCEDTWEIKCRTIHEEKLRSVLKQMIETIDTDTEDEDCSHDDYKEDGLLPPPLQLVLSTSIVSFSVLVNTIDEKGQSVVVDKNDDDVRITFVINENHTITFASGEDLTTVVDEFRQIIRNETTIFYGNEFQLQFTPTHIILIIDFQKNDDTLQCEFRFNKSPIVNEKLNDFIVSECIVSE